MTNHFPQTIVKRDGQTKQAFLVGKIERAVGKAWLAATGEEAGEGLSRVMDTVLSVLPSEGVGVEWVQDAIETSLMKHGQFAVAKAFILYRQNRTEKRLFRRNQKPDPRAVSDYIHASKYAKYRPEWLRREVYEETVDRVEGMHMGRYPHVAEQIKEAFSLVRQKKVLPSMRSMQFGGEAILVNHNRLYNCSFGHIDRWEAFSEALFLLLSGCGVGYSVQYRHVDQLSAVGYINSDRVRHHVVEDTIEGWADAAKALFRSYQDGVYLEFSFYKIRPAGTPLVTSGGRAPGHAKLKLSLERIRAVLDGAQGRKLRPAECHTILCHEADAVLSGGIRRSAMISIFSLEDSEMMQIKTGGWYKSAPWLANSNNSVAVPLDDARESQFKRIFQFTKQFGEPGFFFTWDLDYGGNPCLEIGLFPKLFIDSFLKDKLAKRGVTVSEGEVYSGWSFCNLTTINASLLTSLDDFMVAAKAATVIGTLQAGYTHMPYLGWVSECLAEREALLGVSMTGMFDAPAIACSPEFQRRVAGKVVEWNLEWAQKIGIESAARVTAVKPEGTTSLALGCVASGHGAHHARRYFRRVTANGLERVFQAFKEINPHMCVRKPNGDWVIEFAVEAPEGAIVKSDLSALDFLDRVQSTQQNWVVPGTAHEKFAPGLHHNVSNTVQVKESEWEAVADYLWDNRNFFTGVSLLADTGDKDYAFAPNEAITTEADEARWNAILAHYKPVDYEALLEEEDGTDRQGELACAGGACEVK